MAKIKYIIKENKAVRPFSYYSKVQPNGTVEFDELCEEACENTSIEPSIMRAAVTEYMRAAKRNLKKGFRVAVGEQFIYLYPVLSASVKDKMDEQGHVLEEANPNDFTLAGAKPRIGASVSTNFSKQFAQEVQWVRVKPNGDEIEEEDITQPDTPGGDTPGGDTPGGDTPGGDTPGGSGDGGDGGDDDGTED